MFDAPAAVAVVQLRQERYARPRQRTARQEVPAARVGGEERECVQMHGTRRIHRTPPRSFVEHVPAVAERLEGRILHERAFVPVVDVVATLKPVEELSAHKHLRTLRMRLPAFRLLRVLRELGARVGCQVAPAWTQIRA